MEEKNNKKTILLVCTSLFLAVIIFSAIIIIIKKKDNGNENVTNTVTNTVTENKQVEEKEENKDEESSGTITSTSEEITYTCPDGYTLSGTSCIKTESVSATVNKSCEFGDLDGDYCYSAVQPAYGVCKSGYSYMVVSATCVNDNDLNDEYYPTETTDCSYAGSDAPYYHNGMCNVRENAIITYTCPTGYNLSGSTCVKQETINATKKAS